MKIPKLKSKVLADVKLTPVETRSRRQMFRVDVGASYFGFVEKLAAQAGETHPWKAFRQAPAPGAHNTSPPFTQRRAAWKLL